MNVRWGTVAWLGLATYVVAYDAWALRTDTDTLSEAFGRALAHPFRRWPVGVAWVVTTLHLFGQIPYQIDPFHQFARRVTKVVVEEYSPGQKPHKTTIVVPRECLTGR